jgi:hypothetical protein
MISNNFDHFRLPQDLFKLSPMPMSKGQMINIELSATFPHDSGGSLHSQRNTLTSSQTQLIIPLKYAEANRIPGFRTLDHHKVLF